MTAAPEHLQRTMTAAIHARWAHRVDGLIHGHPCGIDDHPAAAAAGLTTIAQPAGTLGALAAQLLGDVIRGELDEPVDLVVSVDLIVRESTGPGPGRR